MNQTEFTSAIKQLTLHGVFINVLGMGVLLSGRSGIGKSELALGLINRGHRLIADDSVLFTQYLNQPIIIGTCPALLQDFLEVRGLGVLNIKVMFGEIAIEQTKALQLIIKIIEVSDQELCNLDRLHGTHLIQNILGIDIPEVSIPLTPGRNLAILVEGAVRNHALKISGYDASDEFIQKHRAYMQQLAKESKS